MFNSVHDVCLLLSQTYFMCSSSIVIWSYDGLFTDVLMVYTDL